MTESLIARVRQVLEGVGEPQAEFAARVGLTPDKLSKSLSGRRRFTSLELALIAEQGRTTVDWLLQGVEPRSTTRLAARTQGPDDAAAAAGRPVALAYADIVDALTAAGCALPSPVLPASAAADDGDLIAQATDLARQATAAVGTSPQGVSTRQLGEQWEEIFGLVVTAEDLPPGLDGLAWAPNGMRLVLLGRSPIWSRQRFTLAHELGHILAGDAEDDPVAEHVAPSLAQSRAEIRANAFAAEMLMPASELRARVAQSGAPGPDDVLQLSWDFLVSPSAMATRLKTLRVISEEQRRAWATATTQAAARHVGELDMHFAYAEQSETGWYSTLLAKQAITAYVRGDVSIRAVSAVTGKDPDQLLDLFQASAPLEEAPASSSSPASTPELAFTP
ncbi:protein of unknown function [Actinacidiphila yanglinensis]|uniref:IrrE N-terminal-like domain-containing protein n=1 Tax=Actinacidiphila yanglinensis TaxID=310779 RepID=A0A1H6DKN2_9ACTN|nr:ImmA/IrrE family metallo-endopeptidase [Actinacidiphila yanglinensis]SEG85246.1 protein of unknown function [Actinacidiphila yanglinensis]SEG91051.1 protein of unknown function [Actinacidiphila yanglinensis]